MICSQNGVSHRGLRAALLPALLLTLLAAGVSYAQWPEDPAENLLIANGPGEQTTPLVKATSDGGAWVLYYDHASGNYDVYLQRLDADGVPQFDGGLLVSDHPMTTFITEWDFAVDHDDHAIVVTNDIRDGGDWDIFAYRIAPDGDFVWGPDGVQLSDNDGADVGQDVTVTDNGNVVVAWQQESADGSFVTLQMLDPDGGFVWPEAMQIVEGAATSIPRLQPVEYGFYLQYVVADGPQIWAPKNVRLNRFWQDGSSIWPTPAEITNHGAIGIQMRPELYVDAMDNAFSIWYDSHLNNQLHTFVQYTLDGDGTMLYPQNGIIVSDANELQMSPAAVMDPGTNALYVFYTTANTSQTQWGLGAQAFSFNAGTTRILGDNGLALHSLGNQQISLLQAFSYSNGETPSGSAVFYMIDDANDPTVQSVMAEAVNHSGDSPWSAQVSTAASDKLHLAAGSNDDGQGIAVWVDKRDDGSGDVYLQNVNPDGSLGPWTPVTDPAYIELLNSSPLVIPAQGGMLTYDVHVVSNLPQTYNNLTWWTMVTLPNGNEYGPLSLIGGVTVNSGMNELVTGMQQAIPALAPAGSYTFHGFLGFMNWPYVTDSFTFSKDGAVAGSRDARWQAGSRLTLPVQR